MRRSKFKVPHSHIHSLLVFDNMRVSHKATSGFYTSSHYGTVDVLSVVTFFILATHLIRVAKEANNNKMYNYFFVRRKRRFLSNLLSISIFVYGNVYV